MSEANIPSSSQLDFEDIDDEDQSIADTTHFVSGSSGKKKLHFGKELKCMMHGFGDDAVPYTESVELLEDLVIDFIRDQTRRAMEVGRSDKVHIEDTVFLIRKDPKKFTRVKELLTMNEELKKARKAFEEENFIN